MTHLFEPLTLRGVTLRNRIGVSPMCQYSAEDGFANDWHLVHLGARATGGVGLVFTEAVAVEARGRISPNDLGIWSDAHLEMLSRITTFIKSQGAVPGIQLAHAGRKASTTRPWDGGQPLAPGHGGWQPVGASAIPFSEAHTVPHELSVEEIKEIQGAFVMGARRAVEAGFEVIEIHGAHGYLIHSFYSPISNHRTDEYGGSFDHRVRFLLEIVDQVRAVLPDDKVLDVRISATDWLDEGWNVGDSVALARLLKPRGVDFIDCSSSGIASFAKPPVGAGYQVPLAEAVKQGAGIPTAAVGMIIQPMQADEVIRNHRADIVLLGRELLRNPHWALHAAQVLHQLKGIVPPQYLRAY